MKNLKKLLTIGLLSTALLSCQKKNNNTPPATPPQTSITYHNAYFTGYAGGINGQFKGYVNGTEVSTTGNISVKTGDVITLKITPMATFYPNNVILYEYSQGAIYVDGSLKTSDNCSCIFELTYTIQ